MSTLELKTDLHQLIDQVDDTSILKAIYTLLKKQSSNNTIGYTSGFKALTKKEFIKRIEKAESQIKKGQFVSIEELKKESENW